MRVLLWLAGLAAVGYMAWGLVFSDHGYLVYRQEAAKLDALRAEVEQLKAQREHLAERILELRHDPDALEELVHRELGYVHRDEFMVIMPKENGDAEQGARP